MAGNPDKVQTSADVAGHARKTPVVVRRVLGKLRNAGLLSMEKDMRAERALRGGEISLSDVYLALDRSLDVTRGDKEASSCWVEHVLHREMPSVLEEVERSLIARLAAGRANVGRADKPAFRRMRAKDRN
ncbi:Rrf2 family transcriptional regulator [uncultured Roseobacter sp.]|uniref:Rrf2 family transcriptional regulator n=1 Tax=uncultured Roseobacter sp. TaxID=114847 RepID=UPI002628D356|nr:Rrf2 family transcriptional regulator [uncultured Roseobacter sp.]